MKYIALLLIMSFLLAFTTVLGILVLPIYGKLIGFSIGAFFLLLFILIGDKLFLMMMDAKKVDGSHYVLDYLRNISCRLEIGESELYFSNRELNNIFCTSNMFGKSIVVIGKNLEKKISSNEMKALLFLALYRNREGDSRYKTVISLIVALLSWPLYLPFEKIMGGHFILSFINFFVYPMITIKRKFFRNKSLIFHYDQVVVRKLDARRELSSAINKLMNIEQYYSPFNLNSIVYDLALVDNYTNDVLSNFVNIGFTANERYQKLL
jgi:hypothetical protein